MSSHLVRTVTAGIVLGSSLSTAQTVWVVDDDAGPGVDFSSIQVAIDAASDGHVLLIQSGTYQPFVIDGRSLDLIADAGATVEVLPVSTNFETVVRNVGPGQRVLIQGVDIRQPEPGAQAVEPALTISNCSGLVWLQDVEVQVTGDILSVHEAQTTGTLVEQSGPVVIQGAELRGMPGQNPFFGGTLAASIALVASGSELHVYDSLVVGGGTLELATKGVEGIVLTDSFATFHSSTVRGGVGGPASNPFVLNMGDGGTGLVLEGTSEAWSIGTSLEGGLGGFDTFGGQIGDPGDPTEIGPSATLDEVDRPEVAFSASAVVRDEDETVTVYEAGAGDVPFLLFNFAPGVAFVPSLPATSAVGLLPLIFALPPLPAEGTYSITFGAPALPPGLDSFPYFLQVAYFTTGGEFVFSGPQVVHLVDDSF